MQQRGILYRISELTKHSIPVQIPRMLPVSLNSSNTLLLLSLYVIYVTSPQESMLEFVVKMWLSVSNNVLLCAGENISFLALFSLRQTRWGIELISPACCLTGLYMHTPAPPEHIFLKPGLQSEMIPKVCVCLLVTPIQHLKGNKD